MAMETAKNDGGKKSREKLYLRKLRLSLKYRPDIYKLILKLRLCMKKKNLLLVNLKSQLKILKNNNTEFKDSFTQTDDLDPRVNDNISNNVNRSATNEAIKCNNESIEKNYIVENEKGWNISNESETVSIADQVKAVAQNALQQSGMVYVESAGMYYDYKTGYYYNTELGLYYHTDTGCYYYYCDEKKNFVFHSYPDRSRDGFNHGLVAHEKKKARKKKQEKEEDGTAQASKPKKRKTSKKKEDHKEQTQAKTESDKTEGNKVEKDTQEIDIFETEDKEKVVIKEKDDSVEKNDKEELEDGECSGTDSEESEPEDLHDSTSTASDESVAKHHPPCMRVIIRETTLPKLKIGSLYLVTKDGGSIGREGDHHCIVLKDQNVSRSHLNITYDLSKQCYKAMDLGSKNGTILNGIRMSESQTVSKSLEVVHGSILEIGETKLLCHIHPGNDTCGHCEPGLLMESQEKEKKAAYTRTCSVQKQHQLELARLKNKYAPKPLAIEATAYNDRAQTRRDTVGSSHGSEKTQSSDLDTFITPENKGFKLLQKMGWSKGEGLGKDNQGDTEPIPLVSNEGKAGLGTVGDPGLAPLLNNKLGSATLRLANKTKMLRPPAKAFQQDDDDDETE